MTTCNNITINVRAYREGKRDFNVQELNEIKLYFLKYKDQLQSTEFFEGVLKGYKVVSCVATEYYSEFISYMLQQHAASIAVIVDPQAKHVLFQKNSTCSVDINKLTDILCEGHTILDNIVVGKLTKPFLTFTKTLKPC